jgi:hypothetical protein
LLRRFAPRNDVETQIRIPATRLRPSYVKHPCPSKEEGAGKTECALHPRSHVQNAQTKYAHEYTGSAENIRPSLRNGVTTYIALSPVTGFLATVAPEKR